MKLETKEDVAAALWVVLGAIVGSNIPGPNGKCGIPNGHLYASLMGEFDLEGWNRFVLFMKDDGLITDTNYFLQATTKGEVLWRDLDAIYAEVLKKPVQSANPSRNKA